MSTNGQLHGRDFVAELQELSAANVHIKNTGRVNRLIDEIVRGGKERLQIVSDFDRTITKQHENGKSHPSSFCIFAQCKALPKHYLQADSELTKKYHAIEIDPSIPLDEKKPLMDEWWGKSELLLSGIKVSEADMFDVVKETTPILRENTIEVFKKLNSMNIPISVLSAGIGDIVIVILKYFKVYFPNVQVISNFFEKDQNDVISGFNDKMITVFNKSELSLKGTKYYDLIKNRPNVIVLGDSLGDAGMANAIPDSNAVLKIGFLYDHIDGNLPKYLETFDIVLEDDQTMDVLNALLVLM